MEETRLHGKMHSWHEQNSMPIDINIHPIPANPGKQEPAHLHYDFLYLFLSDGIPQKQAESDHIAAWKNIQEIYEVTLKELFRKLRFENILTQ